MESPSYSDSQQKNLIGCNDKAVQSVNSANEDDELQ